MDKRTLWVRYLHREPITTIVIEVIAHSSRNQRFRDREFDVEKDHLRCLYYYGQAYDTTRGPKDMLRVTQIFEDVIFLKLNMKDMCIDSWRPIAPI